MLANQRGLTLVEIIIVVVILASLAAFMASKVIGAADKAKFNQAKIQMGTIAEKLELYKNDCGFYPESDLGLEALTDAGEGSCDGWGPEAYMRDLPKDPWQSPFIYEIEGGDYIITSLGSDRRPGGDGYKKDIVYPDQKNE